MLQAVVANVDVNGPRRSPPDAFADGGTPADGETAAPAKRNLPDSETDDVYVDAILRTFDKWSANLAAGLMSDAELPAFLRELVGLEELLELKETAALPPLRSEAHCEVTSPSGSGSPVRVSAQTRAHVCAHESVRGRRPTHPRSRARDRLRVPPGTRACCRTRWTRTTLSASRGVHRRARPLMAAMQRQGSRRCVTHFTLCGVLLPAVPTMDAKGDATSPSGSGSPVRVSARTRARVCANARVCVCVCACVRAAGAQ